MILKKNFILGYFFGCLLFFLTSDKNLNWSNSETTNIMVRKNEIRVLKNFTKNIYQSSIYYVN